MKKLLLILVVFAFSASALAQTGVKKRRPLPHEYGQAVIGSYSEQAGLAPVVFEHWLHRSMFTCRLCHVDIGFAMKAGATGIKAQDNVKGYYCGTCHNGSMMRGSKAVFEACSGAGKPTDENIRKCERCHSKGKKTVKREYDFYTFTEKFPRERFGNGIDWERAEADGVIKPVDFLSGISLRRSSLTAQKDFSLESKVGGMPEIVFSHKKHTVWNGCEVCHPEIFLGVKKGKTVYSMVEIFEGKFCGACHSTVAFPLLDCQRCHTKPVQ